MSLPHIKFCYAPLITEQASAPEHLSVNSEKGTLLFTRMLIKHRDSFPKSGSHDNVFEEMRKKLLKKGVYATIAELRLKRKGLQERFRKKKREGKTSHEFYFPGSVIFDGANKSVVKGTKYDPDTEDEDESDDDAAFNSALLRFSKGLYIPHNFFNFNEVLLRTLSP